MQPSISPVETSARRYAAWLLALAVAGAGLLLVLFSRPLFVGAVLTEDDLAAFHLPLRAFYHRCLQNGDVFLWMPDLFNGFYVHGEGQAGMLHPLHYALYRFLPLSQAFMLELLSSYPLMMAGLYCFLRQWRVPRYAAVFGALLYAFAGFNMNHYIHMHFVAVMAHLPWLLYALHVAMHTPRRATALKAVLAVLLLSASELLLGIPQATFFSWLVEMGYVLLLLPRTRNGRRVLVLGIAKGLAVLITAAQVLPTADALAASTRSDPSLDFQLSISMRPANLAQMLGPYLFQRRVFGTMQGDEPWDAPYFGAAAPVLMLFLLLRLPRNGTWWRPRAARTPPQSPPLKGDLGGCEPQLQHAGPATFQAGEYPWRSLAWAALGLSLFGLLAALGRYGFLYPGFALIPMVNKLRAPARFVAVAHTGMAIAAALGFAELSRSYLRRERLAGWPMLALLSVPVAALLIAGVALGVASSSHEIVPDWVRMNIMPPGPVLLGVGLIAAAALLVMAAARGWRPALFLLLLLTVGDVALYSLRHKPAEPLESFLSRIELPPVPAGARIEPDVYPITMNLMSLKGYHGPSGYASLIPRQHLDFSKDLPLRLANVHWRETRLGTSPELNAAAEQGLKWMPLQAPFPRARLLSRAQVSTQPNQDLASVDLKTTGLVDVPLDLPGGEPGSAVLLAERPGSIRVRTVTAERQLLVVSESYHPGWRAKVAGQPASVQRVYGEFIGCTVPPGEHEILFYFRPASFQVGKRLSWLGLALIIPLLLAARCALRAPPAY